MNLEKIKSLVEMNTGIKGIETKVRTQDLVDARTIYFVLAKRLTLFTYESIGELVNRDHSSVTHAIQKIYGGWLCQPSYFKKELKLIDTIEKQLLDLNSIKESDQEVVKKVLEEYEIKLIMKNKVIDRLNERIEFLEEQNKELKKYEPIW